MPPERGRGDTTSGSAPTGTDTPVQLITGDATQIVPTLPAASVDAIITDPPFGLLKREQWDDHAPSVAFWTAALRVIKPGGRLVVLPMTASARS